MIFTLFVKTMVNLCFEKRPSHACQTTCSQNKEKIQIIFFFFQSVKASDSYLGKLRCWREDKCKDVNPTFGVAFLPSGCLIVFIVANELRRLADLRAVSQEQGDKNWSLELSTEDSQLNSPGLEMRSLERISLHPGIEIGKPWSSRQI